MAKKRTKRFDEGGDVGTYDYASLGKREPKMDKEALDRFNKAMDDRKDRESNQGDVNAEFAQKPKDLYTGDKTASYKAEAGEGEVEPTKPLPRQVVRKPKPKVVDEDEATAEARMNKIGEDYKKSKQTAPAVKKEYKLNDGSKTTKQLLQEKIDKYGKINDVIDSAALGLLAGRGKAIKEVGKRIEPYIPSSARDLARQGGKRMDDLRTIFDDGIPKLANRAKQLGTEALKLTRFKHGGSVKASKMGSVKTAKPKMTSASSRGDGIAQRGKTKGRIC
jgi:hypothetical protein